jgi:uncharacterized lipoprotein NlpE involved in copper resistance
MHPIETGKISQIEETKKFMIYRLRTLAVIATLVLAFMATIAQPRAVLAAAPRQDDALTELAGTYVSESFAAGDDSSPQYILTLVDDGRAELITSKPQTGEISLEEGEWSVEDDALTLTIIGDYVEVYDEPVEVVFEIQEGVLLAVEFDAEIFGDEGFTLLSESAADSMTGEETAAPEKGSLTFQSEVLPAADTPGRQITLVVTEDGEVTWSTDYMNGEPPIVELGTWESNDEDETVAITLTGREDEEYDEPVVITFALGEEAALEAVEYDESLFGSDGLTLYLVDDEAGAMAEDLLEDEATNESSGDPSGVYVSNILPAASSPGRVILLILYPDGSVQSGVYFLNNEEPISEVGEWVDNGDGSLAVTITGTSDEQYDKPNEMAFVWDGVSLVSGDLVFQKLEETETTVEPTPVAFYMSDVLPAASSPGRQMSLVFYDDGSAEMTTDYMNEEPPIVELGEWSGNDDDTVTLTLTGRPDRAYDPPVAITFEIDGDQLISTEWDENLYGSEGLVLTEQPMEDLNQDSSTANEDAGAEVPDGAVAIFTAEDQPAASSPGINITLILFEDSTAAMISDYQNDEEPVNEYGEWTLNDDGTLTLTLLGADDGDYDRPVEIVFEQTEDGITAIEYDVSVYGDVGLNLQTQYLAE